MVVNLPHKHQGKALHYMWVMCHAKYCLSLLQQYLFSSKATEFLVSLFKDLSFKNVLCLGTPRYMYMYEPCVKYTYFSDS